MEEEKIERKEAEEKKRSEEEGQKRRRELPSARPYMHEMSMTTSIMSEHSSYVCMSTGEESVAM